MAYNLLSYPDNINPVADTTLRNPFFRTTLSAAAPDILVVEEMNSQSGMNGFLTKVLNPISATYSAGTFLDGPDTDNGLFYKSAKFTFISNHAIQTDLRTINEFKLVHLLSGDTIRIYAVHLKASSGVTNEAQRALEVDSLRKVTNALPAGSDFIVCGDFNFYSSSESGYQKLLQVQSGNEGHFIDPITMTGVWNSAGYAVRHTQSTRTRAFNNGSTGGVDDRFDLMLHSKGIHDPGRITYVANSCIAYGNDGNHYNDSINKQPNTAVPAAVADALHYGSDHLPVMATYNFEYNSGIVPDAGLFSLLSPSASTCPNPAQLLQAELKNYGTATLDFSLNPTQVLLQVVNPFAVIQTFSQTLSSGSLASGSTMIVSFSGLFDMTAAGTYTFSGHTVLSGDGNSSNDAMPVVSTVVNTVPLATISPSGPLMLCGGNVTLTASAGLAYSWSTGATTSSLVVSSAGQYSVVVTYAGGCSSTSAPVTVFSGAAASSGTVFTESMGTVSATTTISSHETANGFDNDAYTMSGSGDLRITSSSSGYAGASGGANVYLTTTSGRNFIISDINSSGLSNLQLSFGVYKSSVSSTGSDLQVSVSSDGITYTTLSFAALPSGAGWNFRTATGAIPAVANLRIQFKQTGTVSQYRIDDVSLTYAASAPVVSASGPTTFCQGDFVVLTSSSGSAYLWSTGETTQSISVATGGSYSVTVNCLTSAPVNVTMNTCSSVNLGLKVFIEGFYLGNQTMPAVADPTNHPGICDTLVVELANASPPNAILASSRNVLYTDGTGQFSFPSSVIGNSYYIVVRHRNALETWSASSVPFTGGAVTYDFSTAVTKAYGNALSNIGGVFCMYSGDVSNGVVSGQQDGIVEFADYNEIENAVQQFRSGYTPDDLNGDGLVESADYALIENNSQLLLMVARP